MIDNNKEYILCAAYKQTDEGFLLYDFNVGHDITLDEGFDIGCDSIDWIDYE